MMYFAGQLVLREKAVATAVRSTYTSSTCHTCLNEMPSGSGAVQVAPALLQGSQQHKRYCSPACAMGDTHAALTAPAHGRLDAIAAKTQVRDPPRGLDNLVVAGLELNTILIKRLSVCQHLSVQVVLYNPLLGEGVSCVVHQIMLLISFGQQTAVVCLTPNPTLQKRSPCRPT